MQPDVDDLPVLDMKSPACRKEEQKIIDRIPDGFPRRAVGGEFIKCKYVLLVS